MATSDNVVRAGLTPKFKDVDCLTSMLTYISAPGEDKKFTGTQDQDDLSSVVYKTTVPEFDVACVTYSPSVSHVLKGIEGPSILIVTQGGGKIGLSTGIDGELNLGMVYFVPANEAPTITAGDGGVTMYRAFAD